jgi:hypothetical protein
MLSSLPLLLSLLSTGPGGCPKPDASAVLAQEELLAFASRDAFERATFFALHLLGAMDSAHDFAVRTLARSDASLELRLGDMAEDFSRNDVAIRREGPISLADVELQAELWQGWIGVLVERRDSWHAMIVSAHPERP